MRLRKWSVVLLWVVAAATMNIIYSFSMGTTNSSFSMPAAVKNNLQNNYANGVYWCVKAVPIGTYSTGPYYSNFYYLTLS